MTHAEQIESEKLKKIRVRESKRAYFEGRFSKPKFGGNGHF